MAQCLFPRTSRGSFYSHRQHDYQSSWSQVVRLDGRIYRYHHCGDRAAHLGSPLNPQVPPTERLLGDCRLCKLRSGSCSTIPAKGTQISTNAMVALNCWAISNGLGAHTADLSREELNVQFKVRRNSNRLGGAHANNKTLDDCRNKYDLAHKHCLLQVIHSRSLHKSLSHVPSNSCPRLDRGWPGGLLLRRFPANFPDTVPSDLISMASSSGRRLPISQSSGYCFNYFEYFPGFDNRIAAYPGHLEATDVSSQ